MVVMKRISSAIRTAGLVAMASLLLACQGGGDSSGGGSSTRTGTFFSWMHSEIQSAWAQGFLGQGVNIKVVDTYQGNLLNGNLGNGWQSLTHGDWTKQEVTFIAPQSDIEGIDYSMTASVALDPGLNVLNLSFGMVAAPGANIQWDNQMNSIIQYAQNGNAVVVKSAGNDYGAAVGAVDSNNNVDYLGLALIGAPSAVFVGALTRNGSTSNPAPIASYSSVAGSNTAVQSKFLVVGVEGGITGLYGTSFAAPIVSGYAAILGSKFTTATPTQITNQLLQTARRDTIANYNVSIHGQGEASIVNALAPQSIH